jgi:hypothetical protein
VGLALLLAACGGEAKHASRAAGGTDSVAAGGTDSVAGGTDSVAGGTDSAAGRAGDDGAGGDGAGGYNEFSTSFETAQPQQSLGLWMGLGEELPVELPPLPHDGTALHLVGNSGTGLDVFFHTPLPVERVAREVRFSAYSEQGDAVTVGIAGPSPTYFSDLASGVSWPERVFQVGSKWETFSLSLDDLNPPPPHEEMFGAVHFVVQPHVDYDFWIDDFTLVSRTR